MWWYQLVVWARQQQPAESLEVWRQTLWRCSWSLQRLWSTAWPRSPARWSIGTLPPSAAPTNTAGIIQGFTLSLTLAHCSPQSWWWVTTMTRRSNWSSWLALPWKRHSGQPGIDPSDRFSLLCRCHGDTEQHWHPSLARSSPSSTWSHSDPETGRGRGSATSLPQVLTPWWCLDLDFLDPFGMYSLKETGWWSN